MIQQIALFKNNFCFDEFCGQIILVQKQIFGSKFSIQNLSKITYLLPYIKQPQYKFQKQVSVNYHNMQSLNKQRPFKSAGDDFADTNPIFSYYFYKYFLQAAVNIYKDLQDQGQKAQLTQQLKQLQANMQAVKKKCEADLDEAKNMNDILQYTQVMFAKNDHAYREGARSKQIAQDFLTLSRMYEIVAKFGSLDQQQTKRKAYSKKKFIEIMKEIKNNPQKEQVKMPPPPPPPIIQQQIKKSFFKQEVLPKPSKLISFNKIEMQMQASKALQNAVSELSFDRFKFARQEALRALDILDQLCE